MAWRLTEDRAEIERASPARDTARRGQVEMRRPCMQSAETQTTALEREATRATGKAAACLIVRPKLLAFTLTAGCPQSSQLA
eukprot:6172252-Pleurochrysis_carterae.AAC.1